MDALQRLKEIGIEKIREKTNLDAGKIEDILEKRFEKIAPVRAKGFIQVLEKTFELDLSSWLEEYYQSQKERVEEKSEKRSEISTTRNNALFWVACASLLVLGGGLLYWIYVKSYDLKTTPKQDLQSQEAIVEEVVEVTPTQDSQTNQTLQNPQISQSTQAHQQEIQSEEVQVSQKAMEEYGESVFPNIAFDEENILFITAESPLWVGIINLDTKRRVAKIKKEFEIPLDKQLLINIARGGFSASLDDEEKFFSTYKPVYLIHTINGGLKQISKEEFVSLNGGVEW